MFVKIIRHTASNLFQERLLFVQKKQLLEFTSVFWLQLYNCTMTDEESQPSLVEKMSASSITTSKAPLRFVINCLKILLLQIHTKFKY